MSKKIVSVSLEDFKVVLFIFLIAITAALVFNTPSFLGLVYFFSEMLPFSLSWGEFAFLYLGATLLGGLGLWLSARWLGLGK